MMTSPEKVSTQSLLPTWRLVTDSDSDEDDDLVSLEDAIESIQPVLRWALEKAEKFDEDDSSARVMAFLEASGRDMNDRDSVQFELRRLVLNEKILQRCGFLYRHRLDLILEHFFRSRSEVLVRTSPDPRYLFLICYRGVSNLFHYRIFYLGGWFTLYEDFDRGMYPGHGFETVVELIENYRVFPTVDGRFLFRRPLRYRLPGLKHLCLRIVARALKKAPTALSMLAVRDLGLPDQLAREVEENAFPLESVRMSMIADLAKKDEGP